MKPNPVNSIPQKGETRSDVWIQWYKELTSTFGRKTANSLFVKAWSLRGTSSANTLELRTTLEEGGVHIDESYWDKVTDLGSDALSYVGDIFKVGKYTGIALVGILVVGIGMIVFNVARRPAETAGTIIKHAI